MPSLTMDVPAPLAHALIKSYHIIPVMISSLHGMHPSSLPLISHETGSTLHPPSSLFMPLRVESGLLPSLLDICVCSQDIDEA
ncbi:hypothetical protein F2Q68_00021959 [Brassica cretica]|uniref:Uncharacterized protein n=1 Tax=Brassica cretica TaxID=69181 RepID=A0A8S9FPS1_BRACR|nr:hypothetical protein F2Q68_00021959 [Brassica cretica]